MSAWKGGLALVLTWLACRAAVAAAGDPSADGPPLALPRADNAIYAGVFGSGIVPLSLNYGRRVGAADVRAGLGYWTGSETSNAATSRYSYFSVPLSGAVPIGHGPLRLEVGG